MFLCFIPQAIILLVNSFSKIFVHRYKLFHAFLPFTLSIAFTSLEWSLPGPYFQHVDLNHFQGLESNGDLFFFGFFLSTWEDMCDESEIIPVRGDGEMACTSCFGLINNLAKKRGVVGSSNFRTLHHRIHDKHSRWQTLDLV